MDADADQSAPRTLLQQLLEGTVTSTVTCGTCHTSTDTRQPVWVMSLPLPPDPYGSHETPSLGGSLHHGASGHLSGKHSKKHKHGSKQGSHDVGSANQWVDRGKMGKKEAKALDKAEKRNKRRERKREKQRRDSGTEPEDLSEGDLSGVVVSCVPLHCEVCLLLRCIDGVRGIDLGTL